ncbi:gamma-glutamyltransferase family protein [Sphingomonas sp. HDW15A]|uniref:gamma-glutamyltransferase family protein n=1 Tax=Sphingomonas sp. HDW15A TaxID=2714942 RepID=UPI00140C5231|nr:gamma-glutamyltransferase family protein [Sphingomonas sp. HDW15A]QIK96863.1 gamma-glutamyltransferase family protein [Sphingomonas sp. HDW15A]
MRLSPLFAALALAACSQSPRPQSAAPASSRATPAFVIAANPLAAEAGREVLERGGSAADAAIAVQAMLSLVEPQSSGVGGGAFLNYYDAASRSLTIYDGREVAPAQATASMFLGADGKPLSFSKAVLSGRATGVPGAIAAFAEAHRAHGKLPWRELFSSARKTASDGFIVSPRLARMVAGRFPQNGTPDTQAYFRQGPGGALVKAGDRLRNPAYANFLGRLSENGPAALYAGETAARIVERLRQGELPGSMTMADLAAYQPVRREALCRPWRGYSVCVPPPPSSGVGLLELLGLLERTDIARRGPNDPQSWFLFAEASRLMYADRDHYVGDPAFVSVPVEGLLDPAYLDSRVKRIGTNAMVKPEAGNPPGASLTARDFTQEPAGTSHFVVGDAEGNVLSVTTTVESIFGSGRMVDGFFLNNQLTDFSFDPRRADGGPAANAVAGGKKPRSSMVPTILLTNDGRFAGAIGSAGGNAILAFVAKSLVASVMWGEPMQQALARPNLVARGSSFGGEVEKFPPAILEALRERGVNIEPGQGEDSGVHGVLVRDGRIDGGYDPRREGRVIVIPSRSPR